MIEPDNEVFEAELRRLKPARLPAALRARLDQAGAEALGQPVPATEPTTGWQWWWLRLRWLAPAAAVGLAVMLGVTRIHREPSRAAHPPAPAAPALHANEVVIDRTLLTAFDALATLPDGEPVRLRCRHWIESVTLRDSARGIEVEQRVPRLEVVPISFETY
jgi:hypothetical protein